MQIIVSDIPPGGLTFDCSKDGLWFQGQAPEEILSRFHIEGILFHCQAHRMGQQVSIRGATEIRCTAACTRCLEPFPLSLKSDFFYVMLPVHSWEHGGEEVELAVDDLAVGLYDDDRIDLEPMIAEQVFLQLPIRTICAEGCKGLCSVCGANLNRETCEHGKDIKADSPFAILKNFKVKQRQ